MLLAMGTSTEELPKVCGCIIQATRKVEQIVLRKKLAHIREYAIEHTSWEEQELGKSMRLLCLGASLFIASVSLRGSLGRGRPLFPAC